MECFLVLEAGVRRCSEEGRREERASCPVGNRVRMQGASADALVQSWRSGDWTWRVVGEAKGHSGTCFPGPQAPRTPL